MLTAAWSPYPGPGVGNNAHPHIWPTRTTLQPGSGGGSIRAREINRRLGGRHDITALVAGYPGAKPRLEDGVRWVPIGTRTGAKIDRLAYFALLGPE
jgi:hypothetical protein